VESIVELRLLAERWFRVAATTEDAQLKPRALALAQHYLVAADAREAADTSMLHGGAQAGRFTPMKWAALLQISRLDRQIEAFEKETSPGRSARASLLAALRAKRGGLLQSCGLASSANERRGPPRPRRPHRA
jgi:hypothetical protein